MYHNIREEALKLKVAADWFGRFDCTDIIGRIDFAVKIPTNGQALFGDEYLLWAEAKQTPTDVYRMLTQLLVTIKQDAEMQTPPKFAGCFDNEKIAFVEYHNVLPVFTLNDFDWTQTPSSVDEKSVETVRHTIDGTQLITFRYDDDQRELANFIKQNFTLDGNENLLSTLINRNNYTFIYRRWRNMVLPHIDANWELLKKNYSIYDRDFFLAEINIDDNGTTCVDDDHASVQNFYITFDARTAQYTLKRKDAMGLDMAYTFRFKKGGITHYTEFWKRYKRPPQKEYWDFMITRLDLLAPQDVRERKGAFFTPQIWVEKSQQYLAAVLGENWQDDYYVWDCCAGTGNLLVGLTNKYNIWASTLDQQDVDAMNERIRNGANLLQSHVFQFDFLNDDFAKLPQPLQEIIADPERRKKLVVYINPPYAEATTATTVTGTGANKAGVALGNRTHLKYKDKIGKASNELFAQFFIRIYSEIPGCTLAEFSTLKILQASNFLDFRRIFCARLEKMFVMPAKTFDNVKGSFPIGFMIWNTDKHEPFAQTQTDVYDADGEYQGKKKLYTFDEKQQSLNKWIKTFEYKKNEIGLLVSSPSDFQHQNQLTILSKQQERYCFCISENNLLQYAIYFAVRHCIEATWLNDRDQFLFPNDGWQSDSEFQADCLAFALLHGQNRITCTQGTNHWIPYTEAEVEAREKFASHFMSDFVAGKAATPSGAHDTLFATEQTSLVPTAPMHFSPEAQSVLQAGRALWRYYHQTCAAAHYNPNAALYDIRAYFQGRNEKGKMNNTSTDTQYNTLIAALRQNLKILAKKIEPKVYKYGFLK